MDFVSPVERVIPGVQGRVLAVLARVDTELTMRTVAKLADVSTNRAVAVLNRLVHLGLVERREAGSAALVRLARDNEASQAVIALSILTDRVLDRLEKAAADIQPAPVSMVLFGSFARREADEDSDIDVLVVRDPQVPADDDTWLDTLGKWTAFARRVAGNPVNVLETSADELPRLMRRKDSVWQEIAREGRTLIGTDLEHLARSIRKS
ncbi:MAG TPA: nucleotidyltransferase domain-containing protein [Acidimicrobiales bacterium]|nr:nucleotidyltransferase domain-containing protein [Acidimicrobiales bacterium]